MTTRQKYLQLEKHLQKLCTKTPINPKSERKIIQLKNSQRHEQTFMKDKIHVVLNR